MLLQGSFGGLRGEVVSALSLLLQGEHCHVKQAVDKLVSELHHDQERLVRTMVNDPACEDYIRTLCDLLRTSDVRLCSNTAYILGSLAENKLGAKHLLTMLRRPNSEIQHLLGTLASLLKWHDTETVMNAAGTLGTLAETSEGREWLLNDPNVDNILENVTALLASTSSWTASNAALVLARVTISESGCRSLLEHSNSDTTLCKLINSLQVDEAGCGMNAAFALGRLCETDIGRRRILALSEASYLIAALENMIAGGDAGGSRNACFALSCLAADKHGHRHIMQSAELPQLLNTLWHLLQVKDAESVWFAAMTIRVLCSQPQGVVKLRDVPGLEALLKNLTTSASAGKEVLEEVNLSLKKLQRLCKPNPPQAEQLNSDSIKVIWEEVKPESGLDVTYSLYSDTETLYTGLLCSYTIADAKMGEKYHLRLGVSSEGDNSPLSDPTCISVERSLPSCPMDFRVLGCTTTQIKLGWSPPAEPNGTVRCYNLYKGETLVDSSSEMSYIMTNLTPLKFYTFHVCACTSQGKGEKAVLITQTADPGNHAPSKLTVNVLGRNEIFINWDVPRVPLGRFFNFELSMNGKVVYLGTERAFTARWLSANTEYTFVVSAITSEGKFESKPVMKRTAKDEYENKSKSLHSPARVGQFLPSPPARDPSEVAEQLPALRSHLGQHSKEQSLNRGKAMPKMQPVIIKRPRKLSETEILVKPVVTQRRTSLQLSNAGLCEKITTQNEGSGASLSLKALDVEGIPKSIPSSHPVSRTAGAKKNNNALNHTDFICYSDLYQGAALLDNKRSGSVAELQGKMESEFLPLHPRRMREEKSHQWRREKEGGVISSVSNSTSAVMCLPTDPAGNPRQRTRVDKKLDSGGKTGDVVHVPSTLCPGLLSKRTLTALQDNSLEDSNCGNVRGTGTDLPSIIGNSSGKGVSGQRRIPSIVMPAPWSHREDVLLQGKSSSVRRLQPMSQSQPEVSQIHLRWTENSGSPWKSATRNRNKSSLRKPLHHFSLGTADHSTKVALFMEGNFFRERSHSLDKLMGSTN